jgi:hypothetical protein
VSLAAKRHKDRVVRLGCIVCRHLGDGDTPATIHHVREDQGMSERASDFLAIPLCPYHHTGAGGIHGLGMRAFERQYKLSELDLLAMTLEALS